MKKILLLAGIFSAAASHSAFADMPFNGFIGLNLGATQVLYQDPLDKEYLPTFHGKFGFEGGIKFGDILNVYNIGATAFYDNALSRNADSDSAHSIGLSSIGVGYSAFGATVDNYVRVNESGNSSLYLIGGAGVANLTQTITMKAGGASVDVKQDATALVLRLGGIYNFDEHMGITMGTKVMFPNGITTINYEIGVRYTF